MSAPGGGWRRALPVAEWPAADREAWREALGGGGDVFGPAGPARRWRPRTRAMVEEGYGHWLRFLEREGAPDPGAAPAGRVTPAVVARYAAALREGCRDATVAMRVKAVRDAARALAPGRDWTWLRRAARGLEAGIRSRKAKLPRLRPARRLLELGLALTEEAEGLAGREAARGAVLFRDGLLIALLAARPLRRADMAGLRLGTSVQRRGEEWWIALPAGSGKTGRAVEVPVPRVLTAPLGRYLAVHRPALLDGRRDDHLWLVRGGRPLQPDVIYRRVTRLTRRRLGAAVSPKLFRDSAATSIAVEDPGHVLVAKEVLGHASPATAERHYNQARSLEAGRAWQACVRALRRGRPR